MGCRRMLAMLLPVLAFGQQRPSFDTVSIQVNDGAEQFPHGVTPTNHGLTARNVSVEDCIQMAWRLKDYQISIPAALRESTHSQHYDIVASAPHISSPAEWSEMFRNLLIDRFHLTVHFEKQDRQVIALLVADGGPQKLHEPAPGHVPHWEPGSANPSGRLRYAFYDESVSALIEPLSWKWRMPAIDMTGIQGSYDFAVYLPGQGDYKAISAELEQQLGLRLESRTAPVDVMVVDRVDKVASAN